jgi:hypothetical protein
VISCVHHLVLANHSLDGAGSHRGLRRIQIASIQARLCATAHEQHQLNRLSRMSRLLTARCPARSPGYMQLVDVDALALRAHTLVIADSVLLDEKTCSVSL